MNTPSLDALRASITRLRPVTPVGRITDLSEAAVSVSGLGRAARLGDEVEIDRPGQPAVRGEILGLSTGLATVLPADRLEGIRVGAPVHLTGTPDVAPDDSWIGRVIDPFGCPLDGRPLMSGEHARPLRAAPPPAAERRALGARLNAGLAAFNTFLPLARGQRIGLFAGSGVGKSTLLGTLAQRVDADVIVIALVGERGREVRHFVDGVLGPAGLARAVVIAATSDRAATVRRRCAWTAMGVAEHFRDQGHHVLLLMDSVTRFAEAHRELALAAGEAPALQGYPASLAPMLMGLAERAGPGTRSHGDITALFSVLVAGADMDGPVADTLRGVLDGHVVLDRAIAERGRYPAINLLRSISRSLPEVATPEENRLLSQARSHLAAYERAELMIQSGLYAAGTDAAIDAAVRLWPALDGFLARTRPESVAESFGALRQSLGPTRGADHPL